MTLNPRALFLRSDRYDGVMWINIILLRLVYGLMFFFLGWTTWSGIFTHQGAWEPNRAIAWSVWTAFATLAGLGILRPIKMLPILLLEVFYKVLWLILVALPLWRSNTLAGSTAEDTTSVFLLVILPIVAIPWGYVVVNYFTWPKRS